MDGLIIGYVRISDGPFVWPQGEIYIQFGPKKWGFLLNFTKILWFFWDLGLKLFDIPNNVVFAEILGFSSIFGFPVVNWTPKCFMTVKFWVCPIWAKMQNSEEFLKYSVCLIGDYNPGQSIWCKVEKSSKAGQDCKSLLSNFACFLTAVVKV